MAVERAAGRAAACAVENVSGRERILREARALFTAHGYASVSMQQIADAAGVNKATLYHHFRDKEDLFVAVIAAEFERERAGIAGALAAGGDLRDRLEQVAAHLFASHQSDFGRLLADLREQVSEPRREVLRAQCAPPWAQLREAIAQATAAGETRPFDPELVAQLFFAMVGSQSWWTKFGSDRPAPDARLAATLADILIAGIGAGPSRNSA
ncbi:MAG TPA: TetR/AcrR family transcriptional regulator [Thermomicrobiales bacterium]|nr:TetR/AcrR family transcriptional regulator [Thermomicrobiales bacterium]